MAIVNFIGAPSIDTYRRRTKRQLQESTVVKIACESCGDDYSLPFLNPDIMGHFYDVGWRVDDEGEAVCPSCAATEHRE